MIKSILLILLILSFNISCSNSVTEKVIVNSQLLIPSNTENIKKIVSKEDEIILYITDSSGYIEFSTGDKISFSNLFDKTHRTEIVNNKELDFLYIPLKPFLVITYDDCPESDYSVYTNVHKLYSPIVPAELGLNIGSHALSIDKLKEMVSNGFEIVNHGYSHNRLETVALQKAVKKGEQNIHGWFVHTFLNKAEILIGNDEYTIVSHSSDSEGQYFIVDKPFSKDYEVGTNICLQRKFLENELFGQVENAEKELGTKILNFTYPYTVSDERTRKLISTKYKSSRAYNGLQFNNSKNLTNPGFNFFPFENRYQLNSASFDTDYSEKEIEKLLRVGGGYNAMIILFTHTWDKLFSEKKIKFIIDTANKIGIEISTRSKIWEYYELF